jgi:cellulose synthase/poly-beta-1,6-N-acetylglucosamine synthase-like glycosyltransferase
MWQGETAEFLPVWAACLCAACLCLLTAVRPRTFAHQEVAAGRVLAVVPAYNEDEQALYACVRSLLASQVVPDAIIVVDDGSTVPPRPFSHPLVTWIRQENLGKRGAQATALRSVNPRDFQFILTVDSDSEIRPDALGHLLRAMSDKRVQAATGWIYVRNWKGNWVTRGADMDIGTACVSCRASRSVLGALETTSGALALYRAAIFYDHLDEYTASAGVNCGDDRWMNLRALRRGQTVGVNEAVVETDMPLSLRVMFKQRRRWGQSWWQALPYAYRYLRVVQLLWTTFELAYVCTFPATTAYVAYALATGRQHLGVTWAAGFAVTYVLVVFAQGFLYLCPRPLTWREKLGQLTFGLLCMILLEQLIITPAKYWALLTIRRTSWSTR